MPDAKRHGFSLRAPQDLFHCAGKAGFAVCRVCDEQAAVLQPPKFFVKRNDAEQLQRRFVDIPNQLRRLRGAQPVPLKAVDKQRALCNAQPFQLRSSDRRGTQRNLLRGGKHDCFRCNIGGAE